MRRTTLATALSAAVALTAAVVVPTAEAAPHGALRPSLASSARPFRPPLPTTAPTVTRVLSPGVTLTTYTLGKKNADDFWTAHVFLPATPGGRLSRATTELGPKDTADRVAEALREQGFTPRVEEVRSPAYADLPAGTLGWTVRVGAFAERSGASAELARVKAAGFSGDTRYTAQDGTDPGAPQKVNVIRVDFREFRGKVDTEFGPTLYGTEPATDLVARAHAVAGINGQWFYNDAPGGFYVKDGKVLASATQGRGAILITKGGRNVRVDTIRAHISLRTPDGATQEIDGVNRFPGDVWNCGGVGGDTPTEKPQHDFECTDPSELVRFTPEWGTPPSGAGAEAVLDADDRVVEVNSSRGAAVPAGGSTLQAIGDSAQWLLGHVREGDRLGIRTRVTDGYGRPVPLTRDTTIMQVGPTLVRHGQVSVNALGDGIIRAGSDQSFTYDWTNRANPRSMMGVDGDGRLMLAVVDGRQAGYSEGLSIAWTAELMRRLGAREALNLDGGGSSVMATAADGVINHPSDSSGERSLGDAWVIKP
ncbi:MULTISPECIES: phosphodiester glycosidase family protein [unclassified Streptomyces]|uniref:phosphodiester glycosidase family protein n=1 Tax=unclassified Streptomyces TaxID=2593676 RepID=UPI0034094779